MIIIINPTAGGGTAMTKWKSVEPMLFQSHISFSAYRLEEQGSIGDIIRRALELGETDFVAAGGDGTVNVVLNTLISMATPEQYQSVRLGAIGLGSSNDFHKPFNNRTLFKGIPCRIDFRNARPRDIGSVTFETEGSLGTKYFLSNASIGATADANAFFNRPDFLLKRLKRYHTPSAILYAALKTITASSPRIVSIQSDKSGRQAIGLSNLGIVKNPHFSGSLKYSTPASYDDGKFSVFLAEDMNRGELLRLLRSLGNAHALRVPKLSSWYAASLTVEAPVPFAMEFDGEVVRTSCAQFSLLPRALKVCR